MSTIVTIPEGEVTPRSENFRRYTYKCACGNRGTFSGVSASVRGLPRPLYDYGVRGNGNAKTLRSSDGYLTDLEHFIPTACGAADCSCGRELRIHPVKVVYKPDVVCSAKCVSATRPVCECSCRGKNHGGASSV